MDLYDKIKSEIVRQRLDKTAFAKELGISRNTVYNLGEGTAIGSVLKIINALGMKHTVFFNEETVRHAGLSLVAEEGEVYGVINYKEKYLELLEENRQLHKELKSYTDLKKDLTKHKK